MNHFAGFEDADFDLFLLPGFEERMAALRGQLSPKFAQLGASLKDALSALTGDEMYPHVAKHARRKINPPNDSWVAFGGKRGYKMGPHFQICVWPSHVLIQWGLIYEAANKATFAHNLLMHLDEVRRAIPGDFQWSKDHMRPEGTRHAVMTEEDFTNFAHRLQHNKNGEVMVGRVIQRQAATLLTPEEFYETVVDTWRHLNVLHRLARS